MIDLTNLRKIFDFWITKRLIVTGINNSYFKMHIPNFICLNAVAQRIIKNTQRNTKKNHLRQSD
jgi:hypothetical protein